MADVATPPRLDPSRWWDHQVFRETFLAEIQGAEEVATIRAFGKVFNEMAQEASEGWPGTFADGTAHYLRAALADLRHLQGYFGSHHFGIDEHNERTWTPRNQHWRKAATRISKRLAELADQLERELEAGLLEPDD